MEEQVRVSHQQRAVERVERRQQAAGQQGAGVPSAHARFVREAHSKQCPGTCARISSHTEQAPLSSARELGDRGDALQRVLQLRRRAQHGRKHGAIPAGCSRLRTADGGGGVQAVAAQARTQRCKPCRRASPPIHPCTAAHPCWKELLECQRAVLHELEARSAEERGRPLSHLARLVGVHAEVPLCS